MKKLVSILLVLTMVLSLTVSFTSCDGDKQEIRDDKGVIYQILGDGSYAEVVGYDSTLTEVVIAAEIKGVPVTKIRHQAFRSKEITSIEIPDSVTYIGEDAFMFCSKLESIIVDENNTHYKSIDGNLYNKDATTLIKYAEAKKDFTTPESVTTIGEYAVSGCAFTNISISENIEKIGKLAFSYCIRLESFAISDSVTSISTDAFDGCMALKSITVDENNTYYKSIDGNLYNKDATTLIKYAEAKKDESFTVPESVTTIGAEAFKGSVGIKSITIPKNVTCIGEAAFKECIMLVSIIVDENNTYYKSIDGNLYNKDTTTLIRYAPAKKDEDFTIPESVTRIDVGAFCNSRQLTSITIPESVTSIGAYAFSGKTRINSITFKGTKKQWNDIDLGADIGSCIIYCTDGNIQRK